MLLKSDVATRLYIILVNARGDTITKPIDLPSCSLIVHSLKNGRLGTLVQLQVQQTLHFASWRKFLADNYFLFYWSFCKKYHIQYKFLLLSVLPKQRRKEAWSLLIHLRKMYSYNPGQKCWDTWTFTGVNLIPSTPSPPSSPHSPPRSILKIEQKVVCIIPISTLIGGGKKGGGDNEILHEIKSVSSKW